MRSLLPVTGPTICATCRFFVAPHAGARAGECRISRPNMGADTRIAIWPLVQSIAFCGEHDRRYEEVAD